MLHGGVCKSRYWKLYRPRTKMIAPKIAQTVEAQHDLGRDLQEHDLRVSAPIRCLSRWAPQLAQPDEHYGADP